MSSSPIRSDWDRCRTGIEVRRKEREGPGEIIEMRMGIVVEA